MCVLNMRYAEFMYSDVCTKYAIRGVHVITWSLRSVDLNMESSQ